MKTKFLFLISFLTVVCMKRSFGQTTEMSLYMPYTGSESHITCSDWFYDYGGFGGNYSSSSNASMIICPNIVGQYVSLTFTMIAFADAGDILRIYSGNNASGSLLATYTYGSAASAVPIISRDLANGCLTATFVSNSSGVSDGWDAIIDCSVTPSTNDIEVIKGSMLSYDDAGNLHLDFTLRSQTSFTLNIFSAEGKKVFEKLYSLSSGNHQIPVDTHELDAGIYFCRLRGESVNKVFKFVK